MPVRIYEIAKKFGIESKVVLAKAKELDIPHARVASSTLDKITAEYLEQQLDLLYPRKAGEPEPPPPAPIEPPPPDIPPMKIVTEAEPEAAAVAEPPVEPPAPPQLQVVKTDDLPAEQVVEQAAPAESQPAPAPAETETVGGVAPVVEPAAAEALPKTVAAPVSEAIADAPAVVVPAEEVTPPSPPVETPAVAPEPPPPTPPPPPPKPAIGALVGRISLPLNVGRVIEKKSGPAAPKPGQPGGAGRGQRAPGQPAPAAVRPAPAKGAPHRGATAPALPANAPVITMKPPIIVRELAEKMGRKPHQVIADLMEAGVFAAVNQAIEESAATRICAKHNFRFELEKRDKSKQLHLPAKKALEEDAEDRPEDLRPRAPVVTIMGHVDHGKTTLLDVIRQSNVAAGEAGGITQHIGAYTISFPHPEDKKRIQQITFLDTPGHAAFSAMRARGANVTDIVVLVVAANDGVMPQTIEAIDHAQAARVPIIVAVNKCDHPNANPLKVRQQLNDRGLTPDDWNGDTIFVECSALTKKGVDKLLEMILLQSDMLELKANPRRKAKGNIIESGLEPGGPTATVLVRKGTLKVGDVLLCGQFYGKVRALINEDGKRLKEAGPSVAVKVLGLNGVPEAGLEFAVVEDDKLARAEAEKRIAELRARGQETRQAVTLENLFATMESAQAKVLRLVVKADTQGSVEAIVEALKKIESSKVSLEIIHSAVGTITESDALLASASKAVILGFHTRVDGEASEVAKREGVQIKLYAIIYELIDEVKQAMAGLLDPILRETVTGAAEVRKVFALSKGGNVAGCMVTQGRIARGKVRLLRRRNLVYTGNIASLRRYQDEVSEVRAGMECGIRIEGFNEFSEGDVIECFAIERIAQEL